MSERNMYNCKDICTPETEECPFDLEINKCAVDLSDILELNTKLLTQFVVISLRTRW